MNDKALVFNDDEMNNPQGTRANSFVIRHSSFVIRHCRHA